MSFSAPRFLSAPRLETARLILDSHRAEDLPAYAALWGDPKTMRHVVSGVAAYDLQGSWFRLARHCGFWPVLGYGFWALREKETGRFLGDLGFMDAKRGLASPLGDFPEAGWVLAPEAHGRGYATEAMRAALGWFDSETPYRRSFCLVAPENAPSLRVAAKLGYLPAGETLLNGAPSAVFWREKP